MRVFGMSLWSCAVVAAWGAWAQSAEPSAADTEKVAGLIKKLGDEDFAAREAAQDELSKLGNKIVPILQDQRQKVQDAETQMRLDWLLAYNEPLKAVVRQNKFKLKLQRNMGGAVYAHMDATPSVAANRGVQLKYKWKPVSGPKLRIGGDAFKMEQFHFHAQEAGTYKFELTVTDGRRTSEPVGIEVIVEPADKNDDANAGDENAEAQPIGVRQRIRVVKADAAVTVTPVDAKDEKTEEKKDEKAGAKKDEKKAEPAGEKKAEPANKPEPVAPVKKD